MLAPSETAIPLSELGVGCTARFKDAHLDRELCGFLRAIGLTQTCQLRLCKNGEPCIVQVRSTRIGLSRSVAGRIFVVPDTREGA